MGKDSQRIALSKRFAVYFLAFLSYQLIYAGRDWPSYLNGHLDLTASPLVGQTATLRLGLESNLAESVRVEIVFRLPDGIIAELPELIESQVYLSAYGFSSSNLLIKVKRKGNYPLQASVYATTSIGRQFVDHFYLYLQTDLYSSKISNNPIEHEHHNQDVILPTQVKIQPRLAGQGLVVNGHLQYFNDNQRNFKPLQQVRVSLYQNRQELGRTFSDENGQYQFQSVSINPNQPPQLHIIITTDNRVLTVVNRRWRSYEFKSDITTEIADDQEVTINLTLSATNADRGVGNIIDSIMKTHLFFIDQVGWERSKPIQVTWPGSGKVSYYYATQFGGRVTRETLTIAGGVDQWRSITMYHEYGHAVMMAAYDYEYNSVPRGQYQGGHRLETVSDTGFALSEGWSEFLEAAIDNRALNVTGRWEDQFPNIETNTWWTGSNDGSGSNRDGGIVEGSVASIFWDIFDTQESIDLTPNEDDDLIHNRFDLIWKILVEDKPKTITEIAMSWRKKNFPQLDDLENIYATHHALSKPNEPPQFRFIFPSENTILINNSLQIEWEADDPDGDNFFVDLYYDIDQNTQRANPIKTGISSKVSVFNWNTVFVFDGQYYLLARVKDERGELTSIYSDTMVIVDHTPLLPPKIESPTHPESGLWYENSSPTFYFLTTPEVMSSRRYSFVLDHDAKTNPDTISDPLIRNNQLTLKGLNDGEWWLHLRAKDELDYWTDTSHFKIKIDNTPPRLVESIEWSVPEILAPPNQPAPTQREIVLSWPMLLEVSGIDHYLVQIDVDDRTFSNPNKLWADTKIAELKNYESHVDFSFLGAAGYKYYARIKAVNGVGQEGNWSQVFGPILVEDFPAWDLNQDGLVDIMDLVYVAKFFGQPRPPIIHPTPDINGDGSVNIFDIILVARHFGSGTIASPQLEQILSKLETKAKTNTLPISHASQLGQNFPNPFNPETWIPYYLAQPSQVTITIYDTNGQVVNRLDLGWKLAGSYQSRQNSAYWDGRNKTGQKVAGGVYFYQMQADNFSSIHQMIMLK